MTSIRLCLPALTIILVPTVVNAEHIVDAHINAIGGTDNIAKIKTIHRIADVAVDSPFGEFDGPVTENFDIAGNRGSRLIDIGITLIVSGWVGDTGWQTVPQQGIKDMENLQLTMAGINGSASPVATAKAKFGIDGFSEPVEGDFNEKPCIRTSVLDGVLTFCINKETKLLEGMEVKGDAGRSAIITFDDFTESEGVLFAGKMTTNQPERRTKLTITYSETTVNGDLDEDSFKRPN